jgi:manganese transport protein
LPFAIIPLIRITSHDEMGEYKNKLWLKILGWFCVIFVISLNIWLIFDSLSGEFNSVIFYIVFIPFSIILLIFALICTFIKIEPKESNIKVNDEDLILE